MKYQVKKNKVENKERDDKKEIKLFIHLLIFVFRSIV